MTVVGVSRDAEVVADRARGLSWAEVALRSGLSVCRCQQIVDAWRDDGVSTDLLDPLALSAVGASSALSSNRPASPGTNRKDVHTCRT